VADDLPIAILERAYPSINRCRSGAEIIGLELDILGEPLNLRIAVGKQQAKLADIVPLARAISTKITNAAVEKTRRENEYIPCRPGCAACCHYLVPLSVPEAFRLVEEALTMPQARRRLMERLWLMAARRILTRKPPQTPGHQLTDASGDSEIDSGLISNWYRNFKLTCPFLQQRMCTIYDFRPLACREYFVKGSERACGGGCGVAEKIEMPVHIAEVLSRLAADFEGTSVEAVMLPLVLVWHQDNLHRAQQTWPAAAMVERFVEIVRETASENSAAAAASTQSLVRPNRQAHTCWSNHPLVC